MRTTAWSVFSIMKMPVANPSSSLSKSQTAPRVQTFWWCFCQWQEPFYSWAWPLCLSGSCWLPSTTDGSLPNLRKNALAPSGKQGTILFTRERHQPLRTSHTEEKTDATEQRWRIKDGNNALRQSSLRRQRIMCRPLLSRNN